MALGEDDMSNKAIRLFELARRTGRGMPAIFRAMADGQLDWKFSGDDVIVSERALRTWRRK